MSGSIVVSSCRCWMSVSLVHPVASRSAVFWMICSLLMFVSDVRGDQIVDAYSMTGRVMALYVAMIVSFCLPHVVDVSAFRMLTDFFALIAVLLMCLLYVSLGV